MLQGQFVVIGGGWHFSYLIFSRFINFTFRDYFTQDQGTKHINTVKQVPVLVISQSVTFKKKVMKLPICCCISLSYLWPFFNVKSIGVLEESCEDQHISLVGFCIIITYFGWLLNAILHQFIGFPFSTVESTSCPLDQQL